MRRPPRIAVLIALLAASAAWIAVDLRHPAEPGAGKSSPQVSPHDPGSPSTAKDEPAIPARSTLGRIASDPFSAHSWMPASKPAASTAAPAAPVAPPLPYRFAGQFYRDSGTEVFLARGEDSFPVKEGETLDGQYKIEAVTASEVRFVHVPSGTSQIMQFSALREQDVAPQGAPARAQASVSPPTATGPGTATAASLSGNVAPVKAGPAQFRWEGPASARAGTSFVVSLRVTSGELIRAAPMQLRFDPAVLESVSVQPGRYFAAQRTGNFGYRVNPEGSIFVGVSNPNPASASDAE